MKPEKHTRTSHEVLRDASAVAAAVARIVESVARRCITQRSRFSLVLSGGSSPVPAFQLVASRGRIDWQHVHVFWSDERCVPPDHEESNYNLAVTTMFARAAPPPEQIHRIRAEHGAIEAAALYDAELARSFGCRHPASLGGPAFDLVLLGMGADGHTASLFPGGPELTADSWAAPARAPAGAEPRERVTLTLPAIAAATEVCFIVTGAAKREMAARVLAQPPASVPAALVMARRHVRWLLDREAAAGIGDSQQAFPSHTEDR